MTARRAGLLLHVSSLASPHGIGDLGDEATRIMDWMNHAGLRIWQTLPIGPVGVDGSPYTSWSANLGNPMLLDLRALAQARLVDPDVARATLPVQGVDYASVRRAKLPIVRQAAQRLVKAYDHPWQPELAAFRTSHPWVQEAATFSVLREQQLEADGTPTPWWRWRPGLRDRRPRSLSAETKRLAQEIETEVALAYLFDRQWRALRGRARERGIELFGDMPIYVGGDSVDVWTSPERFQLDKKRAPVAVAGVPPDAFSEVGQLWGNPLYDWDAHAAEGYRWWCQRLERAFELFDIVRIDHFRAFAAYWAVPAEADDARAGAWIEGPGGALFDAIRANLGEVNIVAEDLGTIDDQVQALMEQTGLPGMEVLQFAFDGDPNNGYLPHQHRNNAVAYVGTHDNDTALGWWSGLSDDERHRVRVYYGRSGDDIVWDLIRSALSSVADRAIVTAQDVLALDGRGRMNTPGRPRGNWQWRMEPDALKPTHADRLRELCWSYGRMQ